MQIKLLDSLRSSQSPVTKGRVKLHREWNKNLQINLLRQFAFQSVAMQSPKGGGSQSITRKSPFVVRSAVSTTPALVISLSTIDQITVAKGFSMDLVSMGEILAGEGGGGGE